LTQIIHRFGQASILNYQMGKVKYLIIQHRYKPRITENA